MERRKKKRKVVNQSRVRDPERRGFVFLVVVARSLPMPAPFLPDECHSQTRRVTINSRSCDLIRSTKRFRRSKDSREPDLEVPFAAMTREWILMTVVVQRCKGDRFKISKFHFQEVVSSQFPSSRKSSFELMFKKDKRSRLRHDR